MSAIEAAWVTSVVGALLFFIAGFFSGRGNGWAGLSPFARPPDSGSDPDEVAHAAPRPPPEPVPRAVESAESALRAARRSEPTEPVLRRTTPATVVGAELAARQTLEAEVAKLTTQLSESRSYAQELEDTLREARSAVAELERRLLDSATANGDTIVRASNAESRIEAALAEAAEMKAERDELASRVGRLETETNGLRDDKAFLLADLDDAERRRVEAQELEEVRSENTEMRLEISTLRARLGEVERLQDENVALRSVYSENEHLRAELKALTEQLDELRARGWVAHPPRVSSSPLASRLTSHDRLESIVRQVARAEGVRTATIADELGFPIAGVGEDQDGLAAFSGFLWEVGAKAKSLLPVTTVRRITLETEHGTSVSACPLADPGVRIVLATLTVGPGLETSRMTQALSQARGMLG